MSPAPGGSGEAIVSDMEQPHCAIPIPGVRSRTCIVPGCHNPATGLQCDACRASREKRAHAPIVAVDSPDHSRATEPGHSGPRRTAGALTLTVPMPPLLTNRLHGQSRHWRTLEREKVAYWDTLDERQRCGLLPPPPRAPFERARIASVMYLGAAMDDDGATARHKWPIDWLKTRGYIVDDRKRVLTWAAFPEQIVKRGQEYRIELTLTPLPRAG